MRDTPDCLAAATIRFASRLLKPGQPVSTRIDSFDGEMISVAWPPSTSMNSIRSGLFGFEPEPA